MSFRIAIAATTALLGLGFCLHLATAQDSVGQPARTAAVAEQQVTPALPGPVLVMRGTDLPDGTALQSFVLVGAPLARLGESGDLVREVAVMHVRRVEGVAVLPDVTMSPVPLAGADIVPLFVAGPAAGHAEGLAAGLLGVPAPGTPSGAGEDCLVEVGPTAGLTWGEVRAPSDVVITISQRQ